MLKQDRLFPALHYEGSMEIHRAELISRNKWGLNYSELKGKGQSQFSWLKASLRWKLRFTARHFLKKVLLNMWSSAAKPFSPSLFKTADLHPISKREEKNHCTCHIPGVWFLVPFGVLAITRIPSNLGGLRRVGCSQIPQSLQESFKRI